MGRPEAPVQKVETAVSLLGLECLSWTPDSAGREKKQPVPEFLYHLSRILLEGPSDIIEWENGKILIHNPSVMESDLLKKYFRHSNFLSFKRQLNYFGFHKISGKGKMSPCVYVNDEITSDVKSLLTIKRKCGVSIHKDQGQQERRMSSSYVRSIPVLKSPTQTKKRNFERIRSASCGAIASVQLITDRNTNQAHSTWNSNVNLPTQHGFPNVNIHNSCVSEASSHDVNCSDIISAATTIDSRKLSSNPVSQDAYFADNAVSNNYEGFLDASSIPSHENEYFASYLDCEGKEATSDSYTAQPYPLYQAFMHDANPMIIANRGSTFSYRSEFASATAALNNLTRPTFDMSENDLPLGAALSGDLVRNFEALNNPWAQESLSDPRTASLTAITPLDNENFQSFPSDSDMMERFRPCLGKATDTMSRESSLEDLAFIPSCTSLTVDRDRGFSRSRSNDDEQGKMAPEIFFY